MLVKIQVLAWNRHTHVAELTSLIGHNTTLLIIPIPTVIRINKKEINRFASNKKTPLLSQKRMTKYGQYKNKVSECSQLSYLTTSYEYNFCWFRTIALWAKTIITDTSNSLISISDKHTKHIDLCHISWETRTKMSSNCWN